MNKCKVCGMPHKKKLINKSQIEKVEYIDVNNVSDNQDVYNYIMNKLNEIIDWINEKENNL